MKTTLTGNKDADLYVLLNIENHADFLNTCQINKYTADLCRKDSLFHNRMIKYFPLILDKKPIAYSWKEYYLKIVYYIGLIEKEFPDFNYGKNARGTSAEYLYLLQQSRKNNVNGMIFNNYVDLLQYIINSVLEGHIPINRISGWMTIFEYVDTDFIEKNYTILFPGILSEDTIERFFEESIESGKSGNYFLLKKKFPNELEKQSNDLLSLAGTGGSKLIVDDLLKYGDKDDLQKYKIDILQIVIAAYAQAHKELGSFYYNEIEKINAEINLDQLGFDEIDYDLAYFILALIQSDNMEFIKKAVREINKLGMDYDGARERILEDMDNPNSLKKIFSLGLNLDKNLLRHAIESFWDDRHPKFEKYKIRDVLYLVNTML